LWRGDAEADTECFYLHCVNMFHNARKAVAQLARGKGRADLNLAPFVYLQRTPGGGAHQENGCATQINTLGKSRDRNQIGAVNSSNFDPELSYESLSQATIGLNVGTRNETALVGCEEQSDVGHFVGRAEASKRNTGCELFPHSVDSFL
jgi:hypothetical protein